MRFEPERVRRNAQRSTTEDLLDRVTVYRAGMEPAALPILEAELAGRGVTARDIAAHAEERKWETIPLADGTVVKCSFCHRPAVVRSWGWHWLWRVLPLFPRSYNYCMEHHTRPGRRTPEKDGEGPPPPGGEGRGGDAPASGEQSLHIRRGD